MKKRIVSKKQNFGGNWTEIKLEALRKYLGAYATIMKKKRFKYFYIDGFAGTGSRQVKADNDQFMFPELAEADAKEFLDGSARIALAVEPRFHKYVFIERDGERCKELEKLKMNSQFANDIIVKNVDANEYLEGLCNFDWLKNGSRAVLFLDPFGLQVRWKTLEKIARTKAIDMWLLFPLGSGVNRLLRRDGKIDPENKKVLDELFGSEDWFDEFYKIPEAPDLDLFGVGQKTVQKQADFSSIERYFVSRLKTVFADVATPLPLLNSKNNPIFLFCFAVGNEKGAPTAVKIANEIIKKMNRRA